jgi:plant 4alpha-monomethylsterol monooxygenase
MDQVFDSFATALFVRAAIVAPLLSSAAFLVFAFPYTLLAWLDRPFFARFRIQKKRLSPALVVWPSLKALAMNTVAMMAALATLWPLIVRGGLHGGPAPGIVEIIWQLPVFLVIDDVIYYWIHRALHTRWLYRHIHSVHHRVSAPWAIAGGYFHPVEYLLIMLSSMAGAFILGAHIWTLWIWLVIRQWAAAYGHSGYELPSAPSRWIPLFPSPTYHDYHHSHFVGNYANYLSVLDRLFGTFGASYQRHVEPKARH